MVGFVYTKKVNDNNWKLIKNMDGILFTLNINDSNIEYHEMHLLE